VPIAITPDQVALQASDPDDAERAGYHVACGHAVALLGERGVHPAVRKLSIAGGTTQILLNQVAERVLGLPR